MFVNSRRVDRLDEGADIYSVQGSHTHGAHAAASSAFTCASASVFASLPNESTSVPSDVNVSAPYEYVGGGPAFSITIASWLFSCRRTNARSVMGADYSSAGDGEPVTGTRLDLTNKTRVTGGRAGRSPSSDIRRILVNAVANTFHVRA